MLTFGLQELVASEEKAVHKLELDRKRASARHLVEARADCEGTTFVTFYPILLVMPQTRRARSDNSVT
jgi:hypothetical protein